MINAVGCVCAGFVPLTTPAQPDNPIIANAKTEIESKTTRVRPVGKVPRNILSPSTSRMRLTAAPGVANWSRGVFWDRLGTPKNLYQVPRHAKTDSDMSAPVEKSP